MKRWEKGAFGRMRCFHGLPIAALLVAGLAVGLWLGNDFGMTYDEQLNAETGAAALQAYQGSDEYFALPALPDHGPVYFMMMTLGSRLVHAVAPSWTLSDGRHLTHFFMFLAATYCFYLLCLRLSGRTAAWMATVLFATQPLLLGHGFINQKDTPFMALFLATFVTGILAADQLAKARPTVGEGQRADHRSADQGSVAHLAHQWLALSLSSKLLLCGILLICLLFALDLAWFGVLGRLGVRLISSAYDGSAPALAQRIFDLFASDAHKTPLTYYLAQFKSHYQGVRLPLAAAAFLAMAFVSSAFLPAFADWWGLARSALATPALWISGVLLGATVCVRQQGIFVGGLVSLYFLYRTRSRAGFSLTVYWVLAAIVTYATWPYLWPAPAERFVGSILWAAQFPSYDAFFEGRWISTATRPWYYFPKLAALQLTELAVVLVLIGVALAILRLRRNSAGWFLYVLLAIWIGLPALGVIFLGMTVYGNIRHLLFTLPAILAFTAVSFDWLLVRPRRAWVGWAVFGLAVVSGISSLIYLHPYEYLYLNSFTGGVSGAQGRYELDHECISLREGVEAANRLARPDSTIMILRQVGDVRQYLRPDLREAPHNAPASVADYALTCSWPSPVDLRDQGFHPIYSVHRGEAVLATLWGR